MPNCTYIDGIGSSQAIDTAGEVVDIQGLDCSSLPGAAFNYEHKSDVPAQIVGKVLEFKKIFTEKDCETDRHRYFWNKCQIPFLYVMGRLFDDKKESSKEVAALFQDDAENPHEKPMIGFSIEGAKIDKKGMVITRSIARKVTLTNLPANKTCVSELLPVTKEASSDDLDSIFKTEAVEFFKPSGTYLEFLEKKEKDMKKDVGSGGGAFIGSQMAMSEVPGSKYPSAAQAKGKKPLTSVGGIPKFAPTHKEPSKAPANAPKAGGVPKFAPIAKAMDAGSAMGAPSTLTQGAALGMESLARKKKKSTWLMRAEEAYNSWEKKEEFRAFMKSRLPNMAMGEIDAIGKTLALKKTMDAEKHLQKYSSYFQKGGDKSPSVGQTRQRGTFNQKGVHKPPLSSAGGGTSVMGSHVRHPSTAGSGSKEMARRHAQSNLKDLKSMPKPNLPKSEDLSKGTDAMMASEKKKK